MQASHFMLLLSSRLSVSERSTISYNTAAVQAGKAAAEAGQLLLSQHQ
jgi:hypothetical protein